MFNDWVKVCVLDGVMVRCADVPEDMPICQYAMMGEMVLTHIAERVDTVGY
jgi:hypothetical protein